MIKIKNLINKLNCKVELYGMVDIENELGEADREESKIKTINCNILPSSYSEKSTQIDTTRIEYTHKFKLRAKSLKEPKRDMFFKHKGLKYEFINWELDFKNSEYLNVFTKLIRE